MQRIGTWNVNNHTIRAERHPFSRIVVGVDSGAASQSAARLAISLACGDRRVELTFCHAIDIPRMVARADRFSDDYPAALDAAREEARQLLDACCALAQRAGIRVHAALRLGNPVDEIAALADALAADLVVIGNRPRSKVHRILNGSVRDELVRRTTLPMLVADPSPSNTSEFRPDCILAALADPSALPAALHLARRIAKAYRTRMVMCSGADGGRAIEPSVAAQRPGMIVLSTEPRRGLRDVFRPSTIERVLQSAAAPVLIVPG
jgi:nucleotide-binding universal stress UspA family protein